MNEAPLKPRVIITTDIEVDDMNSLIHLALHLNELDVEAFVYTASQYHFLGDGEHTLGQVTPHYRTKGRRSYEAAIVPPEPDPAAAELTSYRPFPRGWMERLWAHEYAEAWTHLCQNAPDQPYPTPEELCARTYVGNVAFEGDVREATAGSEVIRKAILDNDPRPLWLLSWGGMNTIVRALMSIAEKYADGASWDEVRQRVYDKVRVLGVQGGVGQDNSWLDYGQPLFPELTMLVPEFMYGGYVDAKFAQADARELFCAPWPEEHLTSGNGSLMARYMLYGDGKVYENEPKRFQFGTHARLDWGWPDMEPLQFEPGDFMAEGDSMTYIPLLPFGLRGAVEDGLDTVLGRLFRDGEQPSRAAGASLFEPADPNPYLRAYQEEFAARAQWCAHGWEACNHAPVISDVTPDVVAAPGEVVQLAACAEDPDGDELRVRWTCNGAAEIAEPSQLATAVTVPADAAPGDRLVFTLTVQDVATRPMTRYAQVVVAVA